MGKPCCCTQFIKSWIFTYWTAWRQTLQDVHKMVTCYVFHCRNLFICSTLLEADAIRCTQDSRPVVNSFTLTLNLTGGRYILYGVVTCCILCCGTCLLHWIFTHALLKLELCFLIGILELCLSFPEVFMHPGTVFGVYTVAKEVSEEKVICYQLELGK